MANLASKADNIEDFYYNIVLKFVAQLGNFNLRKLMCQVLLSLKTNPKFKRLNIDGEVMITLANLLGARRSLRNEDFDFNNITEALVQACKNMSNFNAETTEFFAYNCIFWCKLEELSVREKALEFLQKWMNSIDITDRISILRYKQNILDTAIYYLRCHYGNEAQIKSCIKMLDLNLKFGAKIDPELFELPYLDLAGLVSYDKKKKENRFLDMVLDLKINNRQRAFLIVKEKIIQEGKSFSSRTVRSVIAPLIEYFVFELWGETTKASNSYSVARIDRVKNCILEAIKVYGMTVGMLSFPQYIKFLKDIIFYIGKPFKKQDTVLKLVCSCLDNISGDVTDVLKIINQDYRDKNAESLKNSFISTILKTYHDSRAIK